MGTRCAIAYVNEYNQIVGKYSHYDGYPEYTGVMLADHYTKDHRIKGMVLFGDQSVLMKEYIPTSGDHSFETPEKDVTVFYGRDRGELGCLPRTFNTVQEYTEYFKSMGCEYFYLWAYDRNQGKHDWTCWDTNGTQWECSNPRKMKPEEVAA